MNVVYEAKVKTPVGVRSPASFQGAEGAGPDDSFVVTYRRDGTPASYFGDLVWDFSAYDPDGRSQAVSFIYWNDPDATSEDRLALSREARRICFSLLWHRQGASLSVGSIQNYVVVICALAAFAEEAGLSLFDLLGSETELETFASTRCGGWLRGMLGGLLYNLERLKAAQLGFALVSAKTVLRFRRSHSTYLKGIKQHPPMPTRVYLHFIQMLQSRLSKWVAVADEMLAGAIKCGRTPGVGRDREQQAAQARKSGVAILKHAPVFANVLSGPCCEYLGANGRALNVKGLSAELVDAQMVCRLMIQTFTGMREDEVTSLPYDCLEEAVVNGRRHYLVKGRTTKLNHGKVKLVKWVTNEDGRRAILAARAIADAIYKVQRVTPGRRVRERLSHPLFVSTGYLNFGGRSPASVAPDLFVPGFVEFRKSSSLRAELCAVITEEDLRELEQIDLHRAWRTEPKFKVGEPWHFTSHQLRRSLALYAQRSGLVSLPSLRRQLQHLTDEMASYYARGSSFARDILAIDGKHFAAEWQETQGESAGLSYMKNVLFSDEQLFGSHALWLKQRLKGPDGAVVLDREVTKKRFAKGELAYRDTLIGGCTNPKTCDKPALNLLDVECLRDSCKHLVGNLPKLERVIFVQKRLVDRLDPNTVEHRTEKADLAVLESARDRILTPQP